MLETFNSTGVERSHILRVVLLNLASFTGNTRLHSKKKKELNVRNFSDLTFLELFYFSLASPGGSSRLGQ